jgi:beta-carotene 3-hydroxylase
MEMQSWIINFFTVAGTFIGMECVAWVTHKYVMHGFLWTLHHDHHKKDADHFFERNDFFFLIFALPGIACIYYGYSNGFNLTFWVGVGITLYGIAYFFIHDIFIHQRFRIFRNSDSTYLRAIRRAHKMHHKHIDKYDGECFGMLWVPWKYFKEAIRVSK